MKTFYSAFIFLLNISISCAQWNSGGTQCSSGTDFHHRLITSAIPGGSAYITWMATDTSYINTVYITALDQNGNFISGWPAAGTIASQAGDQYAPMVITSEDGGAIVAWYGYPSGHNRSDIFAQKYSQNATPLWNSGNPVQISSDPLYNHKYPVLASDKHNGVYVTWMRYDSVVSASSPDIFLQHIDSSGNVAAGWNAVGTAVAVTPALREYYPRPALSPDQNAVYILYSEGLVGSSSVKMKKVITSTGTIDGSWPAAGLVLSPGPNVYSDIIKEQYIFCDNLNNAIAFWIEARTSANGEIYMQRVSPSGTAMLTANGKCIGANTADGTGYLEIVQDNDDNFLMAFNDYSVWYDIDVIKMAPDGNAVWQNLSATTNNASAYPKPVSDGHGGMFVFYINNATNPYHLYAIALDSTAALYPGWNVPGTDFGTIGNYNAMNPNQDFDAVATNTGQAIVAWDRNTGSNYNVFACNLLSTGDNCTLPDFINNFSENMSVNLYPDPITENSVLEVSNYNKKYSLEIYNASGKMVYALTNQSNSIVPIYREQYNKGIYFWKIISEDGKTFCGKFIKTDGCFLI
ncbi:MAG: T9SS type A sorting domain-containing protein [Bacteroidota bacterium]